MRGAYLNGCVRVRKHLEMLVNGHPYDGPPLGHLPGDPSEVG